jgi:hypothetical protein
MSGVYLINVLDVARSLGIDPTRATPEMVAHWLVTEYLKKRGGGFNYNPAINMTFELFRGHISAELAELHCLTNGNPKGRRQNVEAIKQISSYAVSNISTCYKIGFRAVAVGRIRGEQVYVGIKAPMVRVLHDEAFVVMPGFRMSHRPVEAEIDVACSIALATFAREGYDEADFEYLYAGPGLAGQREFRSIKGRERQVFDRDAVDSLLDTYVKGVSLALDAGVESRPANLHGYSVIDPRQSSMF